MKKRHILLRLVFILANNLYSVPPYLLWVLLIRPLKFLYRPLYHYIEGTLYSWLLELVAFWIHSNNVIVHEAGDDVSDCLLSHSLVVCNHQSTSDVPLLMHYMSSKDDVAKQVCWIMNIMFKYTNFGWVSQVHHDFFIQEGKATREGQIGLLKAYLNDIYIRLNRNWLILFPEGGFFYKRKEASRRYAQKHRFPDLNHCSLPRTGALQAILSTLAPVTPLPTHSASQQDATHCSDNSSSLQGAQGLSKPQPPHLQRFIDLTILYPNGYALSIFDLICRRRVDPLHVVVVARKFDVSELACLTEQQFQTWFFNLWKEKDLMLEVYYNEGVVIDPNQIVAYRSKYYDARPSQEHKSAHDLNHGHKSKSERHEVDTEDNHSSDGEEGYHGIDTEFMDSFKRSWSEVEDGGEDGMEVLPKVSEGTRVKGHTVDQLPRINMSLTRVLALHVFFIASVYLHYSLIKAIVCSLIHYSFLIL